MTLDNIESAVGAATTAGDHALGAFTPDEAVHWYTAALLALPPPRDDERHARAMLNLGIAQRQAGLPEHRDTPLSAARMAQAAHIDDVLIGAALAAHRGGKRSGPCRILRACHDGGHGTGKSGRDAGPLC